MFVIVNVLPSFSLLAYKTAVLNLIVLLYWYTWVSTHMTECKCTEIASSEPVWRVWSMAGRLKRRSSVGLGRDRRDSIGPASAANTGTPTGNWCSWPWCQIAEWLHTDKVEWMTLLTFCWCVDGFLVAVTDGEAVTPMMEPATPGMGVKFQPFSISSE